MAGAGQDGDDVFQPAPKQLGQYEIIAEIARGGMGVVYLARRASEAGFARLFAVKVLYPHLAKELTFIDMLHDEARIAARVHHPHVVPIVDLGDAEGTHYVVMEYVDGCALSSLLARNRESRSPELIGAIMIDALEGLHGAHTLLDDEGQPLHLVHRDVTPQNILVGADGASRITDFGIAKAEARVTTTRPGTWKGKFSYMAPEQLTDDGESVDLRADIFSAGAVLWSALTGLRLFRAESDGATLNNVLHKEIQAPSSVGLCPPQALDEVCLKALRRDREQRFQSALEMAEALRAALPRVGTPADVAAWVNDSFESELALRRAAVRSAASKPRASLPPPLPRVGPSALATASWPAPPTSEAPADEARTVTSLSPHADPTPILAPRPSRRGLIAVVGAVLALIVIVIVFINSTTSDGSAQAAGAESAAASTAAPAASPVATTPESPASPETSASSETRDQPPTQLTALPVESSRPSKPRSTPRTWRAAPKSKPGKPEPPEAPEPTPSEKPAAKPTPKPKPKPGMVYEKNPYLKRE